MRLYEEFTHTIEIEKSRFICILSRVFSEAEAREKIQTDNGIGTQDLANHVCLLSGGG